MRLGTQFIVIFFLHIFGLYREFYEVPPTDSISGRKMPKGSIEAGKICAVKYLNEWHRGKILYVDETVKVNVGK